MYLDRLFQKRVDVPYKAKINPKNNLRTLGFSDHAWEMLAQNQKASKFRIAISLQPLDFEEGNFVALTRRKVSAIIAMIRTYHPETPIEFFITDTLFLHNHPEGETVASVIEMKARKIQWAEVLGLPIEQLSPDNTSIDTSYKLTEQFAGVDAPESTNVTLSSWEKFRTPEIAEFMDRVQAVFEKIIADTQNRDQILLDDDRLFSEDYLGFVKQKFEDIIQKDIGYTSPITTLYREFIGSFALTSINHLKKLYKVGTSLCKATANNETRTLSKAEVFKRLPEETRYQEYAASMRHLMEEFYVTANILIMQPKLDKIPEDDLQWIFYAAGIPNAPRYHPLNSLTTFIETVKPFRRGFSACAEFPLVKHSNDLDNNDIPNSSNGEKAMKHTSVQSPPMEINKIPKAISSQETNNNSPSATITASTSTSMSTMQGSISQTLDTEDHTSLPSSSSSSEQGSTQFDSDEMIFQPDEQPEEGILPGQKATDDLKAILTQQCLKRPNEETVNAALEMWVQIAKLTQPPALKTQQQQPTAATKKTVLNVGYNNKTQAQAQARPPIIQLQPPSSTTSVNKLSS